MLMDRNANKNPFVDQTSIWKKKDSLDELSQKSTPSSTSYSNYLTTNISPTYSTPKGWDKIHGKFYHLNEFI